LGSAHFDYFEWAEVHMLNTVLDDKLKFRGSWRVGEDPRPAGDRCDSRESLNLCLTAKCRRLGRWRWNSRRSRRIPV